MTHTTELLEELEENIGKEQYYFNSNNPKIKEKYYRKVLQAKSQLRGRLDALKEEVEFLEIAFKKDINYKIFDIEGNADFKTRLASIQEEIKLLEDEE